MSEPKVRQAKIDSLDFDERNANKGTERGLRALDHSLRQYGAGRSILLDKAGRIIAGNKTTQGAADIGLEDVIIVQTDGTKLVAVQRMDLDLATDLKARELAIWDNRVGELDLSWDIDELLASVADGVDLSAMFRQDELDALLQAAHGQDEKATGEDKGAQTDRADELGRAWGTQSGQLWEISSATVKGKAHRLLIGDCRNPDDMRRLCTEKVQGVFTSPPYAEQRKEQYGGTPAAEYVAWWEAVQANVKSVLKPDGSFFVNIKAHCEDGERVLYVMDLVLAMKRQWGWRYIDELCWTHTGMPGGWSDRLKNQFEPVFQFSPHSTAVRFENVMTPPSAATVARIRTARKTGETRVGRKYASTGSGSSLNMGKMQDVLDVGVRPGNVIAVDQDKGHSGVAHSAAFPVALPDFFIRAYSDPGDIWLDPFVGSGTTGIAAEGNGRLAYMMEMLPKHGGVILQRFSDMGLTPKLIVGDVG